MKKYITCYGKYFLVRRLKEKKTFLHLFTIPSETEKGQGLASLSGRLRPRKLVNTLVHRAVLAPRQASTEHPELQMDEDEGDIILVFREPLTVRDSSGSTTGIRPDTTAQLGETREGLKRI